MSATTRTSSQGRDLDSDRRAIVGALTVAIGYVTGLVGIAGGFAVVDAAVVVGLLTALGYLVWWRRRSRGTGRKTTIGEALLGGVAAMVVARWFGGMGIELYALVFIAVVWVVTTASVKTSVIAVGTVAAIEAGSHLLGTATADGYGAAPIEAWAAVDAVLLGSRLGLLVAFGVIAWVLVGRRAARHRQNYEEEVERERRRLLEEAREFRLMHAGRSDSPVDRDEAEELIVRDGVDVVHHTLFVTLEMVKTALRAHTVVVLWFDVRNERLTIKELISDSDDIVEAAIDPAGGVIGGITRRRDTVRLSELRPDFRGLAYYRDAAKVTEFIGVPLIEEGHLRGVLCVDGRRDRAFDADEERIVQDAADYVMRAVENERMVASIEQKQFEMGRFYKASRRLNGVLTPGEAYEVALESVRQITAYDFAAITRYDDETDRHRIMEVDGDAVATPGAWDEVDFESNRGLVSMVVRNRHYLPVGGQLRDGTARVLTERQDFSALESLLVVPLIAQDQVIGTMIIGHRKPGEFPTERREMLEVVANQVAVTLQNARMYAEMESMAKYDALTGLANRRTFESKLEEAMARHKRAGRSFGLVLTDIDHFKSVNDTYGHPVGDDVLRRVGEVFSDQMRQIDVPARYGGEEFALILEDTDLEGARQVAERLRIAIAEQEFDTEQGLLQCTISLGIAMGPWDSDEPHELVDLADQALYHSKENGRNRVAVYREIASSGAAA